MRNRAIFASDTTSTKQESGQKAWNTPQEDQSQPPAGPESSNACRPLHQWTPPPATSGHYHRHHKSGWKQHHESPKPKIYFTFAVFGLRKSRENTKAHQRKIHFCRFSPWFDALLTLWALEESGSRSEWKPVCYIESIQKGTPPLFAERQEPFTPIIFRTENTEKGQPQRTGWCRKFFGNFFGGNVSGEKESPQSCGEGARC